MIAGTHKGTVTEVAMGKSGSKGTPRIEVRIQVGTEHIWWHGYINTDENFQRTYGTLITALGFTGDDEVVADGDRSLFKLSAFPKREVSIVVEYRTFEGKSTAQVKWLNSIDGGAQKFAGLPVEEAKATLQKLNSKAAFARAKAALGPAANNDGVPF